MYTAVWWRLYTFTDTSSTPLSLPSRFLSVAPQFPLESSRKSPEAMSTRDFSTYPTAHPEIGIPRRIRSARKMDDFNPEIIVIIIIIDLNMRHPLLYGCRGRTFHRFIDGKIWCNSHVAGNEVLVQLATAGASDMSVC